MINTHPVLRLAGALGLLMVLSACGSQAPDEPATPAGPQTSQQGAEPGPCVVTAEQISELTQTSQELIAPGDDGDEVVCGTKQDGNGLLLDWRFRADEITPGLTELEDDLAYPGGDGFTTERIDIRGVGQALLTTGVPTGPRLSEIDLRLDPGHILTVEATAFPDSPLTDADLEAAAIAVAEAFVAGY